MSDYKPLEGLRVVEMGQMVAASSCCRMLADWGADVIKLEGTKKGDNMRSFPAGQRLPIEEDYNPMFDNLNANKRGVAYDTFTDEGREVVYKLLETADVFVSNYRPQVLKGAKMDWETLHERFPHLIMAQLNGYGEKGEESERPGYDTSCFWARSGFLHSQAMEGGYPVYTAMGVGDTFTATAMLSSVMAAVEARRTTGEGDYIMIGLYNVGIWGLSLPIVASQFEGSLISYPTSRTKGSPLALSYQCKDGRWFLPQVTNYAKEAAAFYATVGAADVAADADCATFATMADSGKVGAVSDRLKALFAQRDAAEWSAAFAEVGLVGEVLNGYVDAIDDRQALDNEYVFDMCYPNGEHARLVRPGFRSEKAGAADFSRGPVLGQHSVEVLRELGYDDGQIESLIEAGLVAQHA